MSRRNIARITGILFILGAILVNIPYTLLIMNFDYPDILREPAGIILERFAAGGSSLVWNWLAFAWVGLPILFGILLLPKAMDDKTPASKVALFFGATGAFVQIIGLLRWPFVVPVLAGVYTNPQASVAEKEAVAVVFQTIHQYGGVVLGEHIGQLFTIIWIVILSIHWLISENFPRWFSISGLIASLVYTLAQSELLATAIPDFPVWGAAGLIGSLMWLAWLIALGALVLRSSKDLQ